MQIFLTNSVVQLFYLPTVKNHKIRLIELVQIKNDGDYVFDRVKRYIHSVEAIGTVDEVLLER